MGKYFDSTKDGHSHNTENFCDRKKSYEWSASSLKVMEIKAILPAQFDVMIE